MKQVIDFQRTKEKLGLKSDKALRQRLYRGQLPYHKWRGRIVFFEDELDQFLSELPGVSVEEAKERISR